MTRIILDAQETNLIRTTLDEQLAPIKDSSLVGFERDSTGDQQNIVATIRSPRSLTYDEARACSARLPYGYRSQLP